MRRRLRFHGLKRIKLRQSWNKYNLYNLSRATAPQTTPRTYFQQKWTAKALTRAYHGETILEKHWKRMFRRSIRSVVPFDPRKLAETDGSIFAMGRGSGTEAIDRKTPFPQTPYMSMVYAPTERRLDTAIFRALFASSTRQARQFVVHGDVKVNGKKMIYPAYQLNPGDMFQVEPERVLYATGAPKDAKERRVSRVFKRKSTSTTEDSAPAEEASPEPSPPSLSSPDSSEDRENRLKGLLSTAKSILSNRSSTLSAKHKRNLREFQRALRRALVRPTDTVDAQIAQLNTNLGLELSEHEPPPAPSPFDPSSTPSPFPPASKAPFDPKTAAAVALSKPDASMLRAALAAARENPIDPSKPYATPWRPRDWMSAFAFVPRYLEVHHRICSAVYLRHPVARPGLAEVPTPYGEETNGLAFNWYLRRR